MSLTINLSQVTVVDGDELNLIYSDPQGNVIATSRFFLRQGRAEEMLLEEPFDNCDLEVNATFIWIDGEVFTEYKVVCPE